jgi:hypothetical protein
MTDANLNITEQKTNNLNEEKINNLNEEKINNLNEEKINNLNEEKQESLISRIAGKIQTTSQGIKCNNNESTVLNNTIFIVDNSRNDTYTIQQKDSEIQLVKLTSKEVSQLIKDKKIVTVGHDISKYHLFLNDNDNNNNNHVTVVAGMDNYTDYRQKQMAKLDKLSRKQQRRK